MGSGALSAGPPAPPTPHKKMKKRKELNALIGLAGERKKPKKGSGHRLLRTEPPASDSDTYTEEDEFTALGERRVRCGRWSVLQCCRLCYPLCGFIVLAACMVTCVGLVWMQVALKENMDALKDQIKAMDSIQRNSVQEIPKLSEDLLGKERRLEEMEGGALGLHGLWMNLTEANKQIVLLTSAVHQLKNSLKSASDMINLPKTMEELQKSVATLGSTVTSVHHDVEILQTAAEEQRRKVDALQRDLVTLQLPMTTPPGTGLSSLSQVEDVNRTVLLYVRRNDLRLHNMDVTLTNVSQRVAALESSQESDGRSAVENSTDSSDNAANGSRADASESSKREEASEAQEQLQLIHVLTNAPDSDKKTTDDDVTSPPPLEKKKNRRSVLRRRQRRVTPDGGYVSDRP